jgi:hypothetical protein
VKYAFIELQRRQHAVHTLCKVLRVSPSGYYAAGSRRPSARAQRQSSLATKIRLRSVCLSNGDGQCSRQAAILRIAQLWLHAGYMKQKARRSGRAKYLM